MPLMLLHRKAKAPAEELEGKARAKQRLNICEKCQISLRVSLHELRQYSSITFLRNSAHIWNPNTSHQN